MEADIELKTVVGVPLSIKELEAASEALDVKIKKSIINNK